MLQPRNMKNIMHRPSVRQLQPHRDFIYLLDDGKRPIRSERKLGTLLPDLHYALLHYSQVDPITLFKGHLLPMLIGLPRIRLLSFAKPELNALNCLGEGQTLGVGLWQLASCSSQQRLERPSKCHLIRCTSNSG